ncbi:MAG: insulinase family protein [Oscillospiraceae bacterium]|nr:insulinase family protein [Oscillospiraceae bacterium]
MIDLLTLPNGVRLVSERVDSVRSAAVGIWVGAGSRCERAGEEGSAHFIEHMLFKGTKQSSAAELAWRMDAIGGQINAFTTRDTTCFYARVLDTHLDLASDILTEMFFDSLFREEDVMSERGVVLEEIDMYRDTPEDLVVEQLIRKAFPGPLGRPVLGRPATLLKMTGEELRAFKAREYSPDRIVISLCGSFSDWQLMRLAERFGGLSAPRPRAYKNGQYRAAVAVKKKSTEQNHFCLSWPGPSDKAEERFAWQVLSNILGGGMSSRLFQTVREKYGLCYSIGSFVTPFSDTGMFAIDTAVNRESERRALELIRREVERFRQEGITAQELDLTREQIKSNLVLALESTSARMNRMGSSILLRGRCDPIDEVIERYDAVSAEDVLSLARERLDPEDMGFSAVGRIAAADEYLSLLK